MKFCQIPHINKDFFICGKVLNLTGHKTLVKRTVCDHCNGEKIRLIARFVSDYHATADLSNPGKYPPLMRMAWTLGASLYRHIKTGFLSRSEKEQARVRAICEACEDYVKDARGGPRCRRCGCFLSVKTRWSSAHCPREKW